MEDRSQRIPVASLGMTGSGNKFHHNVISGADFTAQPYHVAIVIPVIGNRREFGGHGIGSKPVPGFLRSRRRGGNSLLDCMVFGRVARLCARYVLSDRMKATSLAAHADEGSCFVIGVCRFKRTSSGKHGWVRG